MADSRERVFQNDIITALESQGWLSGKASEYDIVNAVYPEDLIGYFQTVCPDRWDTFCKNNPQNPEQVLIKATTRGLDKRGTLEVLRHGFKLPGVKVDLCSFQPDHGMNPDALKRYSAKRHAPRASTARIARSKTPLPVSPNLYLLSNVVLWCILP